MNLLTAESEAQALLEKFKVDRAPVDVRGIAYDLGIEVKEGPLAENVSGVIFREGPKAVVALNHLESEHRRRFTLAHEIGHYVLHADKDLHVDSHELLFRRADASGDSRERVANQFAAALLMPRFLLERESFTDQETIMRVARKFRVSAQAMSYRLVNLGLMPMYF